MFEESLHVREILVPLVADEAAPSGMMASGWPQPKCFVSDSRLAALPLRIASWRPAYLHLVSSSAVSGFVIQYTGIIFNRVYSNRPFHKLHLLQTLASEGPVRHPYATYHPYATFFLLFTSTIIYYPTI